MKLLKGSERAGLGQGKDFWLPWDCCPQSPVPESLCPSALYLVGLAFSDMAVGMMHGGASYLAGKIRLEGSFIKK